jgi:phosphoglycerol transferase MdoB-like AlkP superfamily enzyme
MPQDQNQGLFFSDEVLSKEILKTMNESDQPTVLFAVTMQNHGPYEKMRYLKKNIDVISSADIGKLNEEGLQTYSDGINGGDSGLKLLVSELSKRKRPTLLIFFGDHLPMMGQNFEVFKKTGFIIGAANNYTASELKKLRTTPLVVWSNVQNNYENQGVVSPSFIPNIIDKALDLNNPFYGQFLGSVRKQYNIVDQTILGHPSGDLEKDWRSKSRDLIDKYQSIQYDLMFGKEISASTFFPGFDHVCCSVSQSGFVNSK